MVSMIMLSATLAAAAWCGFKALRDAGAEEERREVFEEMLKSGGGEDADALLREYLAIR